MAVTHFQIKSVGKNIGWIHAKIHDNEDFIHLEFRHATEIFASMKIPLDRADPAYIQLDEAMDRFFQIIQESMVFI
jgi:hypothetical protein